jgi:hypothetical protein
LSLIVPFSRHQEASNLSQLRFRNARGSASVWDKLAVVAGNFSNGIDDIAKKTC